MSLIIYAVVFCVVLMVLSAILRNLMAILTFVFLSVIAGVITIKCLDDKDPERPSFIKKISPVLKYSDSLQKVGKRQFSQIIKRINQEIGDTGINGQE